MSSIAPLPALPAPIQAAACVDTHAAPGPPVAVSDWLGQAGVIPKDAEFVACLHMREGVVVGALMLDLPKVRERLVRSVLEVVRQQGVSVQAVALQSVVSANNLARQAALDAGKACLLGAWQLGTWPSRTAYRMVWGGHALANETR